MIFIPGNVPSLKNSRVSTRRGSFAAPAVRKYLQYHGIAKYSASKKLVVEYKTRPCLFRQYAWAVNRMIAGHQFPVMLGFHFNRSSKRSFDFVNAVQLLCDLLVAFQVIPDDNMDYLLPVPLKLECRWYSTNSANPGVYITVIPQ